MEGGVREDRVDRLVELELEQVGDAELDAVAELGQLLASVLDHRRRGVDADHPALGQAFQSSFVTRPLPQPASSTVSLPSRSSRARTSLPHSSCGSATRW